MRFERARAVADAVLFEGYALYPYRPTSTKNQLRWQFGVLAPRAWSEAGGASADPWWLETQLLVAGERARLDGLLRFLRVRRRALVTPEGRPLDKLDVDGHLIVPWDEGEVREVELEHTVAEREQEQTVDLGGDEESEAVGALARVVRTRTPIALRMRIAVEPLDAPRPCARVRLRVENVTPWRDPRASRDAALAAATVGTHLIVSVDDGEFVSLLDPPAWARDAAASCRCVGSWPVLAGAPGANDLVLAAPIILYDHPQVAPESPGDLFDATEIDEILTLRTLMLSDEEKRLARATDARVAAIVDRVEAMPPEVLRRLHGAIRALEPVTVRVGDAILGRGSRVRLRPGARRSDAQDMFLDGRAATVQAIKRDVDGRECLAVTVDDDPAADLHAWHGRYHYFYIDEIEPLA